MKDNKKINKKYIILTHNIGNDKILNSIKYFKKDKNMNARKKAEDFFYIIATRKKSIVEIPLNYSQGEVGTLLYLNFIQDNVTASELSEKLNVSLPRTVSIINSLESKKLLTKRIDKEDKRKTIINITEDGRKLVLEKKEECIEKLTKIIEKLDERDINEYIRIAEKIGRILDDMQD